MEEERNIIPCIIVSCIIGNYRENINYSILCLLLILMTEHTQYHYTCNNMMCTQQLQFHYIVCRAPSNYSTIILYAVHTNQCAKVVMVVLLNFLQRRAELMPVLPISGSDDPGRGSPNTWTYKQRQKERTAANPMVQRQARSVDQPQEQVESN